MIVDARKDQAKFGLAPHRPRRVAHEDVDLARPQCFEALAAVRPTKRTFFRIVEDGRCKRTAIVDIEARPFALLSEAEKPPAPG